MLIKIIREEPARFTAAVIALIGVLSAFGLGITSGQSDAIVSLVGAVLVLLGGETVRAQVTPTVKLGKHARRDAAGVHQITDVPPAGGTPLD